MMKRNLLIFVIAVLAGLAGCDNNNENSLPSSTGNEQPTISGSTFDVLEGYENASQGFNTLKPEGLSDPLYIREKALAGDAYQFVITDKQRLDEMAEVPAANQWQPSATISEGKCYWIKHTSTQLYTYLKLRIAYIEGNNVGVEYIIDSTEQRDPSAENANANEADDTHPFVTDLAIPHLNSDYQYVEHTVDYNNKEILNYALEWVEDKRHAAWVAFSFDSETSQKNVNRTNDWLPDPFVPTSPEESDHKSDGFDKGHLCASEDRVYNRTANEQTFYYTNISPQMTSFNGGYWITFEKLLQTWARSGDYEHIYVAKGGTMNKLLVNFTGTQEAADERLPQTDVNGLTSHGLACPAYYFMAVLAQQGNNYQAIGFLVEHKDDYGYSNSHQAPVNVTQPHALSIDALEEETGLDFFCNLPDNVETEVEANYQENDWEWVITE